MGRPLWGSLRHRPGCPGRRTTGWSGRLDAGRSAGSLGGMWSVRPKRPPPARRLVGGCSATNALFALRGSPADSNEWAARSNPGWSFDEVLPFFSAAQAGCERPQPAPWTGRPAADHALRGLGADDGASEGPRVLQHRRLPLCARSQRARRCWCRSRPAHRARWHSAKHGVDISRHGARARESHRSCFHPGRSHRPGRRPGGWRPVGCAFGNAPRRTDHPRGWCLRQPDGAPWLAADVPSRCSAPPLKLAFAAQAGDPGSRGWKGMS